MALEYIGSKKLLVQEMDSKYRAKARGLKRLRGDSVLPVRSVIRRGLLKVVRIMRPDLANPRPLRARRNVDTGMRDTFVNIQLLEKLNTGFMLPGETQEELESPHHLPPPPQPTAEPGDDEEKNDDNNNNDECSEPAVKKRKLHD